MLIIGRRDVLYIRFFVFVKKVIILFPLLYGAFCTNNSLTHRYDDDFE